MSLQFDFCLLFPSGSLSTELSDFHRSAQSRNEHECKQTLKNMLKMECHHNYNVISTTQHIDAQTFSMQIFLTPETLLQAILPFPSMPPKRPGELAHRLRLKLRLALKLALISLRTTGPRRICMWIFVMGLKCVLNGSVVIKKFYLNMHHYIMENNTVTVICSFIGPQLWIL